MKSIPQENETANQNSQRIKRFMLRYRLSEILKKSNAFKEKGVPVTRLIQYLFCLVFQNHSMYLDMLTADRGFAKDTVYRLKNSIHVNWMRLTTLLSARIVSETIRPLSGEKRRCAFVIDDSVVERSRSKHVELASTVFDHAKNRYVKGFRMLTLGWSDGVSFIPVNSCLLSSPNAERRMKQAKEISTSSNGYARRCMALKKATEVSVDLVKEAQEAGLKADYVLFDSWFSSPHEIHEMKKLGLDTVAMVKKSSKIYYRYNGEMVSCKDIYARCKKRRGRSRYLLSAEVEVCSEGNSIPAKLVYVRNRNRSKDYLVLICTDMSLSEDEIIQLYGKRWDIEVFFKTCKSLLRLTTECRSLSYDAMTAHTAIVFLRYMFLAVEIREDKDLRTAGPLFCLVADELADISFSEAMQKLQLLLRKQLQQFNLPENEISALFEALKSDLPRNIAVMLGVLHPDTANC